MNDSASTPEFASGIVPAPHWQKKPVAATPFGSSSESESPLLIRLPDLNASNKPNLKLVGLPDEAEPAPVKQPAPAKSVMRIDPPTGARENKTAAAAAAGLSPTTKWMKRGKLALEKAKALTAKWAQRLPDPPSGAKSAAAWTTAGVFLLKLLPSRGQFLAIIGVLLLGAALMTRGSHKKPSSLQQHGGEAIAAAPVNVPANSISTSDPTNNFARQMPAQPVPIRNAGAPVQTAANRGEQVTMPVPNSQSPTPPGGLPAPGPNPNGQQQISPGNPAWPVNSGQSYEAKRPQEPENPGGRLSAAPPVTDPRDRAPYMAPNAPVYAEHQPASVSPSEAAGITPRVASRDMSGRVAAPQSGIQQPPAARLEGNIAYPPLRGSYDRAGSSLY